MSDDLQQSLRKSLSAGVDTIATALTEVVSRIDAACEEVRRDIRGCSAAAPSSEESHTELFVAIEAAIAKRIDEATAKAAADYRNVAERLERIEATLLLCEDAIDEYADASRDRDALLAERTAKTHAIVCKFDRELCRTCGTLLLWTGIVAVASWCACALVRSML